MQRDAIAVSDDFASQIRHLGSENALLKQQNLQLQQQLQHQSLQAATCTKNSVSADEQRLHDAMRSLELAHAEQQKMSAAASAAQSECDRLQLRLTSVSSAMKALQDTTSHHEQHIEQQQIQIHELQSHVEEARGQAARSAARASAADAEIVRISAAASEAAAAAEKEREEQQQIILHLQDVVQQK